MASYFSEALDATRYKIVDNAIKAISGTGADCIAVRGCSGLCIGPIVAYKLGINLFIARKPNESSHTSFKFSGQPGKRTVILDDFICTGTTVKAIAETVKTQGGEILGIHMYRENLNRNFYQDMYKEFAGMPFLWSEPCEPRVEIEVRNVVDRQETGVCCSSQNGVPISF